MRVPQETSADFARTMRQVHRVEEDGHRMAEHLWPVLTFEYQDARAPIDVATPLTEPPLAVRVLDMRDQDRALPSRYGGRAITWVWRSGAVRVLDVDVPTSANTYDVTIELVR